MEWSEVRLSEPESDSEKPNLLDMTDDILVKIFQFLPFQFLHSTVALVSHVGFTGLSDVLGFKTKLSLQQPLFCHHLPFSVFLIAFVETRWEKLVFFLFKYSSSRKYVVLSPLPRRVREENCWNYFLNLVLRDMTKPLVTTVTTQRTERLHSSRLRMAYYGYQREYSGNCEKVRLVD